MKRWLLAVLALLAVTMLPSQGKDVGQLRPVGLLYVFRQGNLVCVETDTGESGQGADLQSALLDMKTSASGVLFLETTEKLVITEAMKGILPQLQEQLRPGTRVLLGQADLNAEEAYDYLSAKREGLPLKDWKQGTELPRLQNAKGRFHIV